MPNITCCYNCPDRLVTEEYNCHDHCEKYIAQKEAGEYERKLRSQHGQVYAQRSDSVYKMKKKWRHQNGS